MSLSMHQMSVSFFDNLLGAFSAILDKAEAHCQSEGLSQTELLEMRLAPDMYTLTQQVQRACFHASGAAARLVGIDLPEEADDEASIGDLKARVARTRSLLSNITPAQLEGSDTKTVEQPTRIAVLSLSGADYLTRFALPQFTFHLTTAHGIIRNAGIQVGKIDFLGHSLYEAAAK